MQRVELLIHGNLQPWRQMKAFSAIMLPSFKNTCLGPVCYQVSASGFPTATVDWLYDHTTVWKSSRVDAEPPHPPYEFRDFANLLVPSTVIFLAFWKC